MSTRAVVGVGTLSKWTGVYNHSDGYPTGLGQDLYEHITRERLIGKSLKEIGESILKFDDYENYRHGGICRYCGKLTGQAHTIGGPAFLGPRGDGIYPDPSALHHQHHSLVNVEETHWRSSDDFSDIEWAYIINPKLEVVHVISTRAAKKSWKSGHVGDLRFDEVPNFTVLECGANFERCHHYAWYHFPEMEGDKRYAFLGTAEYLGRSPLTLNSAYAVKIDGIEYSLRGGVRGGYNRNLGPFLPKYKTREHRDGGQSNVWYGSILFGNWSCYAPVAYVDAKGVHTPYPGVQWVYPPTLFQAEKLQEVA